MGSAHSLTELDPLWILVGLAAGCIVGEFVAAVVVWWLYS